MYGQTATHGSDMMDVVEARSGALVRAAIDAHRHTWTVFQDKPETSCMQVLEMGEVTRRLRAALREMITEYRAHESAQTDTVIIMDQSHAKLVRDFRGIWSLYRDCMADYHAMYNAYMFKIEMDLPAFLPFIGLYTDR